MRENENRKRTKRENKSKSQIIKKINTNENVLPENKDFLMEFLSNLLKRFENEDKFDLLSNIILYVSVYNIGYFDLFNKFTK